MPSQQILSFENIDAYMSKQIEHHFICGAVLLIAQSGKILHEKAYGYAQKYQIVNPTTANESSSYLERMSLYKSLLPTPLSLTTDHLFDLASLTKVLATTIGIMLLLEQNKLNLDHPIKRYLPEFNQPDKEAITIRHLLSHSSGLAAWKPLYYHMTHAEDVIKFISDLPLDYAVDSQRKYSDLAFIILRYIIEHVANQPFAEFLQTHLYQKLNLKNILFNPRPDKNKIASTSHGNPFEYKMIADDHVGYHCDEDIENFNGWRNYTLMGEVNDANTHHVFAGISGHAGLFATARDINVLLQLMLNHGRYQHEQIFQLKTVQEFITKNKHQHGLGWFMASGNTTGNLPLGELANNPFFKGAFGHTGFTGTLMLALPTKQISIVLLTNTQNLGVNSDGRYNNLSKFYESVITLAVIL